MQVYYIDLFCSMLKWRHRKRKGSRWLEQGRCALRMGFIAQTHREIIIVITHHDPATGCYLEERWMTLIAGSWLIISYYKQNKYFTKLTTICILHNWTYYCILSRELPIYRYYKKKIHILHQVCHALKLSTINTQ